MHFFPSSTVIISFGPFAITWYAAFILTGALIAYKFCQRTMTKWGYSESVMEDYAIPMLFCGVAGARIYYVIFQWGYYSKHLEEIVMTWHGGLAIHGGLIAGAIFSYFYFKKKKIHFLRAIDAIMPNVLIAQACGRWGNFMNREAFGGVVSEEFINHFPAFIKNRMFIDGAYHHPTFLYESVANIIGFLFITFIFRKKFHKKQGDNGFMYLLWYGIVRFFIEGLRTDSLMFGPLRVAQCISLLFVLAGVLGLTGVFHKVFHLYTKPVVLFDLDGTLQDSQAMIYETFKQVFKEELNHECTQEELNSFFGPTLEETFIKYFPEDKIPHVIDRYQEINRKLHYTMLSPIEHAHEMLTELKKQGIKMGIVSNKRNDVVRLGLEITKLDQYFDVVLGKESLPVPKPDPSGLIQACTELNESRDALIYVGDAPGDIKAAKNMAAYSIGYSPDENRKLDLVKENPNRIIDDLLELVDICKENRTWNDNTIW